MQQFRHVDFGNTDQVKTLKTGEGNLTNLLAFSQNTAAVWIHIYDQVAAPTPGTDVPTWSVPVNAGVASPAEWAGAALPLFATFRFRKGCHIAATTSQVHTVATAPTSDLVACGTVD